jgi:hypothetical protein
MKDEASQIVGKRIIGVIIKNTKTGRPPNSQLFLVFDDHTSFEFYSDAPIKPTGGIDKMSFREVYNYMEESMEVVFHAVEDPDSGDVAHS